MGKFKTAEGPWIALYKPGAIRLDLHFGRGDGTTHYTDRMRDNYLLVLQTLKDAQVRNVLWVLITHGASTSGPGKLTARSVVRGIMRDPEATPYIVRKECVQHETAFLVRIKTSSKAGET